MSYQAATLVFIIAIVGLFWLDRDDKARPSKALWVAVAWLFVNSSRPLSMWLSALGLWHAGATYAADMYLEGSPVDGAFFTILLLAGLFILVGRVQRLGHVLEKHRPIIFFFSYCFLSILWSDFPWVTFKHWNKGIGDVVMALIVLTDSEPTVAIRRLFTRIGFVLIPLSVLFIKYIPDLGRGYTISGVEMYTGVTTQKNALGILCLIIGVYFLWSFVGLLQDRETRRRNQHLIADAMILAMVVYLLWMCNSMTSISCLLMAGGAMLLAHFPLVSRRQWIVHLLVAAMVFFTVFTLFFDAHGNLLQDVGRNPTLTGRTAIWSAVISMAKNPLIGAGYESFWLGDRLQQFWSIQNGQFKGINEAHNGYIEIYLNLGWIGVALLAGLIVRGYNKIIEMLRSDPRAGSLALAFFVAEALYCFAEAGFRMMCPLWILFLMVILGSQKAVVANVAQEAEHEADFSNVHRQAELSARF